MSRKTGRSRNSGRRTRKKKGGRIKKVIIGIAVVCVLTAIGFFVLSSLKKDKMNEPYNTVTVDENTVVDTNED